jgi:uncharacterized membrane protein YqjE
MTLLKKLIPFLVVFSTILYFIRTSDVYNTKILLTDIGGIPYLYAVVGTIFGVIAAFAIQKEWEEWNALTDAVRGEVDGLEKLYLWSSNFPQNIKNRIHNDIKCYLRLILKEGWKYSEKGEKSQEVEDVIIDLNNGIYAIFDEAPQLMPTSFALLSTVLNNRSARLQHSSEHMPPLLRNTLQFAAFLLIGLSMFIAIKNIWLAFLFTASIASLAYSIFLVLIDLDNPLKPGDWHITTKDYKALLEKIS